MEEMDKNIKKRAIRRLKIIEGQIRGLQKMVGKGEYCIDILHQSSAVKQALSGVEDLILKSHLSTHVVEQIKTGKELKPTKEILEIYKLSKKK
jgi:DNA-binding FrmR family transcriptional regulator